MPKYMNSGLEKSRNKRSGAKRKGSSLDGSFLLGEPRGITDSYKAAYCRAEYVLQFTLFFYMIKYR